jgi:hypothetical protein
MASILPPGHTAGQGKYARPTRIGPAPHRAALGSARLHHEACPHATGPHPKPLRHLPLTVLSHRKTFILPRQHPGRVLPNPPAALRTDQHRLITVTGRPAQVLWPTQIARRTRWPLRPRSRPWLYGARRRLTAAAMRPRVDRTSRPAVGAARESRDRECRGPTAVRRDRRLSRPRRSRSSATRGRAHRHVATGYGRHGTGREPCGRG